MDIHDNLSSVTQLKKFHRGTSYNSYKIFGCHLKSRAAEYSTGDSAGDSSGNGAEFVLWAPGAAQVKVVGDFNEWGDGQQSKEAQMHKCAGGIWKAYIKDIQKGDFYKYEITKADGTKVLKSDPYACYGELRPGTASIAYSLDGYVWSDEAWMEHRKKVNYLLGPVNIYEVHLGSWRTQDGKFMNYREIADELAVYAQNMHYTHVEVMPVSEHPFDGSWGYQTQCFYSITSRYGTPHDFMYFVDRLHESGIGVILDWVPGHFCKDTPGLYNFDGTWLYEYEDEERRENRQWGTANFDLNKGEVQSFLISNAIYFMDVYHIDGLRVDAVANILYMDYGKPSSAKLRNKYGGNENIEGIQFLRELNKAVFANISNPLMIAEDSSAWPLVTKPDYIGGLGFNFKWSMGWMNDTLEYIKLDPIYRKWHHGKMTFSLMYAFSENYILPLSHDEVVHGKKSLVDKMPGTYEQKFAGLRCYYTYMMGHPGKKLLFMGGEFGQFIEWRYYEELEWKLLEYPMHEALKVFVQELNYLYKKEKAFWEADNGYEGFSWIDADNTDQSIFTFIRKSEDDKDFLVFVCNFTPVEYEEFKIGVPRFADYFEILNSDSLRFGGSGVVNKDELRPSPQGWNGQPFNISIKLPANGALIFKPIFRK